MPPHLVPTPYYAKGSYFTLAGRAPFERLIYPVPEAAGLGVHLTLDLGGQATNVLAIAPGKLLALDGNPVTRKRLELAGCEVETYIGEEISLNRFGGPTCLTRPILRG